MTVNAHVGIYTNMLCVVVLILNKDVINWIKTPAPQFSQDNY